MLYRRRRKHVRKMEVTIADIPIADIPIAKPMREEDPGQRRTLTQNDDTSSQSSKKSSGSWEEKQIQIHVQQQREADRDKAVQIHQQKEFNREGGRPRRATERRYLANDYEWSVRRVADTRIRVRRRRYREVRKDKGGLRIM